MNCLLLFYMELIIQVNTLIKCFLNTLNNYKQIKTNKLTTAIENNLITYEYSSVIMKSI